MKNFQDPCGVVIMAAGQGKRMRSALPKVLHPVSGQPMIFHILDRILEEAPGARVALVAGHGREQVEEKVRANPAYSKLSIAFVHQAEQKGTGHAVRCAMESDWGEAVLDARLPVLVLPGDLPLIPGELIRRMTEPLARTAVCRLLTCELQDPTGYGRVVRKGRSVQKIVEEKDASPREKAIREVAASIYLLQSSFLNAALKRLSNRNAQGEYYLTDLIAAAAKASKKVEVLSWPSAEDLRGVNNPWELALAQKIMNERHVRSLAERGVRFVDPWSVMIDVTAEIGEGTVIQPGVILTGCTRIGRDAVIKAGTVIDSSTVGDRATVGPYAHLRPESEVGEESKIGNFVELKKTRIGRRTSVAHLSYLGDAEVGDRVNIGCGFVTCNFDGRVIDGQRKHRTVIEDDAFIGSDCQAVAPVRLGRGAYVASGSTITEDVEAEALAIARSRQVNKPGYARKLRGQGRSEEK